MSGNLELALKEAAKHSKYNVQILTCNEPEFFPHIHNAFLRKLLKGVALIVSHVDIGKKMGKAQDGNVLILYGFATEFLFLTYLFSGFRSKNVYLLIHHNIQQACRNSLMKWLLKMYHYLHYNFIVNEASDVLQDIGYSKQELERHISLLHPVIKRSYPNSFSDDITHKKKVGIVGKVRKGKQFATTLNLLLKLQKSLDFLLVVGTDDFSSFDGIDLQGAKLVNTSSYDDYFATLSSCDIIILNYEKSKYFYRCSGVAADAISVQTYVVCPNFSLMSSQVNYPTQVGVLYNDETDLPTALKQALELAFRSEISRFESHYVERSPEKLALVLDRSIEARV